MTDRSIRAGHPRVVTAAVLVGLAVLTFVAATTGPGVDFDRRAVADTDGYMRLSRVTELRSGEVGWFDSVAPRSNAPFGHTMHWTRALDAVLIVLAAPLDLFMSFDGALYVAALVVGPLLLAATAAATVWAALPVAGLRGAVVAGIAVALQPTVMAYGTVARVDHHSLLFLLFALLVGTGIRLGRRRRAWHAAVAGAVAAAGLWVSTEFLLPIAITLLAFLAWWLIRGAGADLAVRFSLSWVVSTGLVLLVERGFDWADVELDRVSVIHLVLAIAVAAFWLIAGRASGATLPARAGTAAVAGLLAGGGFLALFPSFLSGPFGDVPAELWDAWLGGVAELQALWPFGGSVPAFLYLLAVPLAALAIALWSAWHDRARSAFWLPLAAALAGLIALSIAQLRFTAYPQLAGAVVVGWATGRVLDRIGQRPSPLASIGRVATMAAGTVGFFVPTLIASAMLSEETGPVLTVASSSCDLASLESTIDDLGGEPVVLAHIDYGPRLLYVTDARVVASPYHRNVDGILDGRGFWLGDAEDAMAIAEERGVDLVALCPHRERAYLGRGAETAFWGEVVDGAAPTWLDPIPTGGDLMVFRVG